MKRPTTAPVFLPLVLVMSLAVSRVGAVSLGDDRTAVESELGPPVGEVVAQDVTVLVYARGEVRLRDGRVTAIQLVSEEEHAARLVREAEFRERARADREARLARIEAEGRELKANKTRDPDFLRLPASSQLQFWRSFASRYPMISIDAEIAALRERIELEKDIRELENASEDRIARLEARVAEAERRADDLALQANALRYFGKRSSGSYYGSAIVIGGGWHRPRVPHKPVPVPYADPISEARGRAMGDIEESRRQIYSGRRD